MPIPEETLYQYESFCDYALDCHFRDLFKAGNWFDIDHSRVILWVENNSITHIGDIKLSGTYSMGTPKYMVVAALCREFRGMYIRGSDVSMFNSSWSVSKKATRSWLYRDCQTWLERQIPIDTPRLRVHEANFNVRTTLKTKLSKLLIREQLHQLNPKLWLSKLGVSNSRDGSCEKRVAINSIHIPNSVHVHSDWHTHIFWDVPNDVQLLKREGIFDALHESVSLPFVSLPLTQENRAMAFDGDDFLPNPRQRRELFRLVKMMNVNCLEAYFDGHNMIKHTFGHSDLKAKFFPDIKNKIRDSENRWIKLKAVTSHQPNSVLGQILLEEDDVVIKFTLNYFSISAETINQLKIGSRHAVEMLIRSRRLSLVRPFIAGRLKAFGKVYFRPQSFVRVWSAAFAAIEENNKNSLLAAIALDKGTQLHIRGERGITALGLAVINDRAQFVAILLDASANVNQPSWGDETPLGLALNFGVSREIIQKLIKAGAKVNRKDLTGTAIEDQLKSREIFVA